MVYADDVLLMADSKNKLQETVIQWGETLSNKEMIINLKKSRIIKWEKQRRK